MKKINYLDYSNITALVIDDAPIVITSIRIMLRQMGLKDENISHNKEPSASICQAKSKLFDIFICDYNFGKSLNGKQVFEEIQHYQCIKSSAIFIMITGESSGGVVRSIIELAPDGYMLKPYNLHDLRKRIQTAFIRKKALHRLYEINLNGDFESGISECKKLLALYPEYQYQIQQFLGLFYQRSKRLDDAKKLYEDVLAEKNYDWANIGLANTLIDQKQGQDAATLLENILAKSPNNSNALMAMSHLNIYSNDIPSAIKHLSIASELIPGNSDRELMIANLCHAMEDYTNALQRYRAYFFSNKDTYRDTPTATLNYIRAIIYQLEVLDSTDSRLKEQLRCEAKELLSTLHKDIEEPAIVSEIELVCAHFAINEKRLADASVLLNKVYRAHNITCFYGQLHLCILLDKLNYKKEGQKCLTDCQENIALHEHELVAQSQLMIIQFLVDKQRLKSDKITQLLQQVKQFERRDDKQQALNCYLKINKLAPYLQQICVETISCLVQVWPSDWTAGQVRLLISECHNTVEQMMSVKEKNKQHYYDIYDLAIRKSKAKSK